MKLKSNLNVRMKICVLTLLITLDEKRKELNNWLGATWTSDMYDLFIQRRLDNTCEWILSQPIFTEWLSTAFPSKTAKNLWINGTAGYGKTMLCARIIQHLSTLNDLPLGYFFFSSNSESRSDPYIAVRSWISQVVSQDREAFKIAFEKWEEQDNHMATQTDTFEILRAIVQHLPNCTFIADGLDECIWSEDNRRSRDCESPKEFFESIRKAIKQTETRILFVSRDEPNIRHGYHHSLANDGQTLCEYRLTPEDVRSDAMSFSRDLVDRKLSNKTESQRDELSQRMVNRCDGMFLWIKMLEDDLAGWMNKKKLQQVVDQAPTAIDSLYDRNWNRISSLSESKRRRAFSILRWATFSLRPLSILEITEALLIPNDNDDIDNTDDIDGAEDNDCEGLLLDELPDIIDKEYIKSGIFDLCGSFLESQTIAADTDLGSMTIHLAHFSVKQYILGKMTLSGASIIVNKRFLSANEASQSNILAMLCLRYLDCQIVWKQPLQFDSGPIARPFLDYASRLWSRHIKTNGLNYSNVINTISSFFNQANENWASWRQWVDKNVLNINDANETKIPSFSPLFYASMLGIHDTVKSLILEAKFDVNHIDGLQRTALQAACSHGNLSIVKMLIENGSDLTIADSKGRTPLHLAANKGYTDVVKFLLERRGDISISMKDNSGGTALKSATARMDTEMVDKLMDNCANLEDPDNLGNTPLGSAARFGHAEVVKLLLEHGASVSQVGIDGNTPLNLAIYHGHVEVSNILISYGADVTMANNTGYTPIHYASYFGVTDVITALLEKGADVTAKSSDGWTALLLATLAGHTDVIKILLKKCEKSNKAAIIAMKTPKGWTSLNIAASNGHLDIVELLLNNGASLEVSANCGHDSSMNITDCEIMQPLHHASSGGHIKVVELLLDRGVNINAKGPQCHYTALYLAATNGHVKMVQRLLESGADPSIANISGLTPLNSAVNKGYEQIVLLLLEKDCTNINVVDNNV
jgi:ankyrin repeat protein